MQIEGELPTSPARKPREPNFHDTKYESALRPVLIGLGAPSLASSASYLIGCPIALAGLVIALTIYSFTAVERQVNDRTGETRIMPKVQGVMFVLALLGSVWATPTSWERLSDYTAVPFYMEQSNAASH